MLQVCDANWVVWAGLIFFAYCDASEQWNLAHGAGATTVTTLTVGMVERERRLRMSLVEDLCVAQQYARRCMLYLRLEWLIFLDVSLMWALGLQRNFWDYRYLSIVTKECKERTTLRGQSWEIRTTSDPKMEFAWLSKFTHLGTLPH